MPVELGPGAPIAGTATLARQERADGTSLLWIRHGITGRHYIVGYRPPAHHPDILRGVIWPVLPVEQAERAQDASYVGLMGVVPLSAKEAKRVWGQLTKR